MRHVATIAERVESSGIRGEWFDDLAGQGRTFRFRAPGGHLQEVFWEAERYQAPPQLRTDMPDRPQKYRPRGAAVAWRRRRSIERQRPVGGAGVRRGRARRRVRVGGR